MSSSLPDISSRRKGDMRFIVPVMFATLLMLQHAAGYVTNASTRSGLRHQCFDTCVLWCVRVWWDRWETRRIDPHELVRTICLHSRYQNKPSSVACGNPATCNCCVILRRYNVFCHIIFFSGFSILISQTSHQLISIDMK